MRPPRPAASPRPRAASRRVPRTQPAAGNAAAAFPATRAPAPGRASLAASPRQRTALPDFPVCPPGRCGAWAVGEGGRSRCRLLRVCEGQGRERRGCWPTDVHGVPRGKGKEQSAVIVAEAAGDTPGTSRRAGLAWGSSPGRQRLGRPGRAGLKLGVRLGGGGREAGRRSRPEQRGPRGQEAAQGAGGMGWRTGRRRGGPVELTGRAGSLAGRLVRPLGQQDRRGRGWRGLGRAGAEPGRGAQLRGFRGAVWKAGRPTLVVCHENRARRRWRPASSRGVGWGPLTESRARPLSPRLGDGPGASEALVTSRACGPGQPRRGPSRHGATRQVAENGAAAA